MGTLESQSGMSSAPASISDLDGFTIRDYQFPPGSHYAAGPDDDFGFDPPKIKPHPLNISQAYSPPNDLSMSGWPEFERDDDLKPSLEAPLNLDGYEMDKFISSTLPNSDTAVSRYGQVTPPRSTSAASADLKSEEKLSPKSLPADRRKRGKARPKPTDTPLPAPSPSTTATATTGRKRKSTRRPSSTDDGEVGDDHKRKQSLEKNRLAAAKCRVNKKEKTDRLQRDSHDKAVENAYLKDQVMRMKDEIQQMNSMLLAHANCDGCKSPDEIQAHLTALDQQFFTQQLALGHPYGDYSQMDYAGLPAMDSYFSGTAPNQLIHPPLPEFNRTAEFEVHTPMPTD